MPSNNTFYQSDILALYPFGLPLNSGEIVETAQSIQVSTSYQRQNISRLGKFSLNRQRVATEAPTISMSVEYIPTGINIFRNLGLLGDASPVDNLLSGSYKFINASLQQRNIYGVQEQCSIYFSSGVLTNFGFNVSVGSVPSATFDLQFLSYSQDTTTPVIQQNYSEQSPVMTAKDIQISSLTGIIGIRDFNIQSFSMSVPLGRNFQYRIGDVYPFTRELNAPVLASIQLGGLAARYNPLASGFNIETQRQQRGDYLNEDFTVTMYKPTLAGEDIVSLGSIFVTKPYLESIQWGTSVGAATQVNINLLVPITFENGGTIPNVKIRQ